MKRSRTVRRILLGGLTAGALVAGATSEAAQRITSENFYTNDSHIPGAGYYHAPFNAFFPQPYNYFDPQRKQYYFGGQWGATPHQSIINISVPTAEAARRAESVRTDIARGGFGHTAGSHSIRS